MATLLNDFYRGKRVFVTGHTGFKGSWLCKMLVNAGAEVTGYSLEPPTTPSLFEIAGLAKDIHSVIGDIRDLESYIKSHATGNPLENYPFPVGVADDSTTQMIAKK